MCAHVKGGERLFVVRKGLAGEKQEDTGGVCVRVHVHTNYINIHL